MFYCLAASAIRETLDSPSGVPTFLALLSQLLLPSSVALWVLADARQRRRSLPYDAGSFIFFTWPVLAPIYHFSTRGWRAFAVLGWFLLLYVAAAFFGRIPDLLFATRQ